MSLLGQDRRTTPVLHCQSLSILAHYHRFSAFPGSVRQLTCTGRRGGSHARHMASKQCGWKECELDGLGVGSEFLVPSHHLAQEFSTDDVHRRLMILAIHQAGKLF